MIGWYTDNDLSKRVMESIPGIELRHIRDIYTNDSSISNGPNVFYGILRGCGNAMYISNCYGKNYYYIDNGYFDALYVDKNMHKNMDGKFRVVKNGMHEVYPGKEEHTVTGCKRILVIPPSSYSANFYDTTPEDWTASIVNDLQSRGCEIKIRHKSSVSPLKESIDWCDATIVFNSMSVMTAIEAEKPVMDTHGILKNYGKYPFDLMPVYDLQKLRDFYEPKQFTLEEFKQGKCQWDMQ